MAWIETARRHPRSLRLLGPGADQAAAAPSGGGDHRAHDASRPSRSPVGEVHPSLAGRLDLQLENLAAAGRSPSGPTVVFCCLPHGASAAAVKELLPRGKKVIDLSADYRLNDAAEYAKWYGLEHADPRDLKDAVYGLPELYRDEIRTASLVANPGCYPTSAILPSPRSWMPA